MSVSSYLLTTPCKICGLLWDREGGLGPELNQPRCPACRNMHEVYPDLKVRTCLKCDRQYLSIWSADRVCPACREENREFSPVTGSPASPSSSGGTEWQACADCGSQLVGAPAGPEEPGLHHQEQSYHTAHQNPEAIHALEEYLNVAEQG